MTAAALPALLGAPFRWIDVIWTRWRMEATEAELLERSLDGSLSDEQAVNYIRACNYYADRLAALTSRNQGVSA